LFSLERDENSIGAKFFEQLDEQQQQQRQQSSSLVIRVGAAHQLANC
jgi:hypothetical protein